MTKWIAIFSGLLMWPAYGEDLAADLERYVAESFPAKIERVIVGDAEITVSGISPAKGWELVSVPMEAAAGGAGMVEEAVPVAAGEAGKFTITVPRRRDGVDRLLARWQLVKRGPGGLEVVSHARYADEVACRAPDLPEVRPATKKGLGGWNAGRIPGELEELGISAVTVNVVLNSLVALEEEPGTRAFEWQGRVYFAREAALAGLDETFHEAEKNHAMVLAILLVHNPARGGGGELDRLLAHPDATKEGVFAMPNLTSVDGVALYGAVLSLMAERWCRPGGEHGRVHHWIMHNEVDAGWEWTNAGEKPDVVYLELYQRSMRMMDLIARQYDPHSRPLISLTHHWAEKGQKRWYGSKRLLELLAKFSATEGNFGWGLAHHPYPQSLRVPTTWKDDQATPEVNTRKITPRNLEVLDAFMKRPEFLDDGEVRPVHLSENGFNSKDYTPETLAEQAAGMAFAWKKMEGLSSIQCWEYHNWIDNRQEGGLRIGLRKFPDEPGDPLGKKPIWELYKALGTEWEEAACAPYWELIGR